MSLHAFLLITLFTPRQVILPCIVEANKCEWIFMRTVFRRPKDASRTSERGFAGIVAAYDTTSASDIKFSLQSGLSYAR